MKYKVCEFATNGWQPVTLTDVDLSREEAKQRLENYLAEGYNPNRLKAFPMDKDPNA
jgi:hypothetical protein